MWSIPQCEIHCISRSEWIRRWSLEHWELGGNTPWIVQLGTHLMLAECKVWGILGWKTFLVFMQIRRETWHASAISWFVKTTNYFYFNRGILQNKAKPGASPLRVMISCCTKTLKTTSANPVEKYKRKYVDSPLWCDKAGLGTNI